ncbi:uncharacterized protein LOC135128081 [Zophobas morio]|uniref:uncharacterized protein LOC135128081 n=1 Tax=Zophobas morio TaxID=2755281 RepID=UPI0030830A1E
MGQFTQRLSKNRWLGSRRISEGRAQVATPTDSTPIAARSRLESMRTWERRERPRTGALCQHRPLEAAAEGIFVRMNTNMMHIAALCTLAAAGGGRTCARENNHLTPAFTWTDANFSSVREHDRRVRWEVKVCACGDEEVDRTRLFETTGYGCISDSLHVKRHQFCVHYTRKWRIEEESNNGYQHGDTTNRDVSVIMLGPNPSTSTVEHFTYRVNIIAMPLATRLLHGYHCPVITA